jgi:prophage antirepressor-like protein
MAHDTPPDLQRFAEGAFSLDVETLPDGSLRYLAPGLARGLGYRTAADMLRTVPEDQKGYAPARTLGGDQHVSWISERFLYQLIGQRSPADIPDPAVRARVDAFQAWIFGEVLPSIRQRGYYATPTVARELHERLAGFALTADAVLASGRARAERQLLAGVEQTPADRDAELREVRSLVDMARHARALLSGLQLDGPVAVPESVLRLAESAGVPVPGGAHGLDPWRR